MILFMPILRLGLEILLLVFMLKAGIRDLSDWAILLIVFRLSLSCISRIHQIPYLVDEDNKRIWGVTVCIFKILSEVGIFFSLKEDINISMNFVGIILFLMLLRNISDTWSLLAIELDE